MHKAALGFSPELPYKLISRVIMDFNHTKIRTLRQRLGWSQAEMARQMGCSAELIQSWESGSGAPDSEALNQLRYLHDHVELKSHRMQQTPLAEKEMQTRGVGQLTHDDLLKDFQ